MDTYNFKKKSRTLITLPEKKKLFLPRFYVMIFGFDILQNCRENPHTP